jgi:hypothetical protein
MHLLQRIVWVPGLQRTTRKKERVLHCARDDNIEGGAHQG